MRGTGSTEQNDGLTVQTAGLFSESRTRIDKPATATYYLYAFAAGFPIRNRPSKKIRAHLTGLDWSLIEIFKLPVLIGVLMDRPWLKFSNDRP
jgi:hypothetical protein